MSDSVNLRPPPKLWLDYIDETDKFTVDGVYFPAAPFRQFCKVHRGLYGAVVTPPHFKLSHYPFPDEAAAHITCRDQAEQLRAALGRAHSLIRESLVEDCANCIGEEFVQDTGGGVSRCGECARARNLLQEDGNL